MDKFRQTYEFFMIFAKIVISFILLIVIFFLLFKLLIYLLMAIVNAPAERFTTANIDTFLSDILLAFVFIELFRTVYVYIIKKDIYLQALIETALIAVLRKILLIEVEKVEPFYIISLSILIGVLFFVYFRFVQFAIEIKELRAKVIKTVEELKHK